MDCTSLVSITIPATITWIGDGVFNNCTALTAIYFQGDPPPGTLWQFSLGADNAVVYYPPGTDSWGAEWRGCPTALWNPAAATNDGSMGIQTNGFIFNITASSELIILVEACTNLTNPTWVTVGTNTLANGLSNFSDPHSSDHPSRFYRLRSP